MSDLSGVPGAPAKKTKPEPKPEPTPEPEGAPEAAPVLMAVAYPYATFHHHVAGVAPLTTRPTEVPADKADLVRAAAASARLTLIEEL